MTKNTTNTYNLKYAAHTQYDQTCTLPDHVAKNQRDYVNQEIVVLYCGDEVNAILMGEEDGSPSNGDPCVAITEPIDN